MNISKDRTMFVAERFISNIVDKHGRYPISTDGGTWYAQACTFLKIEHYIHPLMKKA